MSMLVIARYHCEVAGKATESLDYRVKFFESDDLDEVTARLRGEQPCTYENALNEAVSWIFDDIVATQFDPQLVNGKELIGFITGRPQETD
jgi:hypothetical protein